MNTPTDEIAGWIRRLRWALGVLPAQDRDEIVASIESHLHDALEAGRAPAEVLAGFGDPETCARGFIDQMEISHAAGSARLWPMLRIVVRRVPASLLAAGALAIVLLCAAVLVLAASVLASEIVDPLHTGLWRGGGDYFIGTIDDPAAATDLLGFWLLPAALAGIVVPLLLIQAVLRLVVRRLARPA